MYQLSPQRLSLADFAFFAAITLISVVGINPYTYGLYNHNITVPFVLELMDPGLYPGDWLMPELAYFYTWFLPGVAGFISWTGWSIETSFFVLYVISAFGSFAAFYRLSLTLGGSRVIAVTATLLFLFGFKTVGYVGTFETHLMERTMALPFELLAIERALRGKWTGAFLLAGLAFPIHPLSAMYTGAIVGLPAFFALRRQPLQVVSGLALFLLLIAPGLYLKFTGPAPDMPAGRPEAYWLDILALRSAYHVFPFSWSPSLWIRTAMFCAAVGIAAQRLPWRGMHRNALLAGMAVLIMCLVGTVFSEFIPLALPIQFQFFRSFRFFVYLALIVLVQFLVRVAEGKASWRDGLLVVLLAAPAWVEMVPLKYLGFLAMMLTIFPGWYLFRRRFGWSLRRLVFLPVVLVCGLALVSLFRHGLRLDSHQQPAWREAQLWARDHTPVDAGFIVPPVRWGFRVESQRSIYGDWNDGTQTFFNQEFGLHWLERMKMLGYDGDPDSMWVNYNRLDAERFQQIAVQMGASSEVYAVCFKGAAVQLPELWSNAEYRVLRVR